MKVGDDVVTILRRGVYTLAAVVYMFFASGYLSRALDAMPASSMLRAFPIIFEALTYLEPFRFSIALAPLCIMVARSRQHLGVLLVYYIGLLYVGMLGGTIIAGERPIFGASTSPPWRDLAEGSVSFLAIFVALNLIPTAVIWRVARTFWSRARAS